ncbi:MAG: hypothetical protein RL518_1892 [Pseudomonadota bacterium]
MRVNTTHLFFAFAFGLGLSIIFTFPKGSSGTVRLEGEPSALASSVGRIAPSDVGAPPLVVISTSTHSLTIHRRGQSPLVLKAQGAYAMKHGTFSVSRKEVNPLWQAPPTYFLRRGLPLPAEGSSERAMRGALGTHAIFLDQDRAIHSGAVWNEDVGGVKIAPQDMALLFDAITVGATVEIR